MGWVIGHTLVGCCVGEPGTPEGRGVGEEEEGTVVETALGGL